MGKRTVDWVLEQCLCAALNLPAHPYESRHPLAASFWGKMDTFTIKRQGDLLQIHTPTAGPHVMS